MALIVKENTQFQPLKTPLGMQHAVCAAVYDIGIQKGFNDKPTHKIILYFELAKIIPDGEYAGKRYVASKEYTASLSEKATLRNDLHSWRGRDFTPEELKGFNLEKVIGKTCNLNIIEKISKSSGNSYAYIAAINPRFEDQEKLVPEMEPGYKPDWIQKKMECAGLPQVEDVKEEEEIPF